MLPLRLPGLMLPFDPLLEIDIGSTTDFSGIGTVSKDEIFALEDERNGTVGTFSVSFPCDSDVAAISDTFSFAERFDVAVAVEAGWLYSEPSSDFTIDEVESVDQLDGAYQLFRQLR